MAQLREASALRDEGDYGGRGEEARGARGERARPPRSAWLRARLLRADGEPEKARARGRGRRSRTIPAAELRAHLYAELARSTSSAAIWRARPRRKQAAWDATRDSDYAARLLTELAQAYETRDKPAEALALYTRAWQRCPLASAAVTAFARGAGARSDDRRACARSAGADRARRPPARGLPLRPRAAALRLGAGAARDRRRGKPALERSRAECLFMRAPLHRRGRGVRRARGRRPERPRASFQRRARCRARAQRDAAIAALEKLARSKDSRCARARARSRSWR